MFELSKDFRVVGSVINPDASYRKIIVGNFFYGDSVDGGVYSIEFGGSVNSKPGHLRNYLAINGHINYGLWSSSALPVNTSISYDSTYDASNRRITNILEYDGISVSYDFSTISQSGSTSRSLRFFLDYRPDNGVIANPVSIGKTQMYKAGILVGDFVPTKRNSDNVLGMYDKVTNTFLTNSGTGIFIAGPYAGEMGTCTNVGPGYYAAASTVNFGSTGTRTACPVGLHTVGYGHGADEANDCGRILHIGNYRFYAHRNKQTTPSINIMVGNERFYISLSPTDHNMSKLHLMHNGTKYTAYDDSLLYGERDFDTGQQVVQ